MEKYVDENKNIEISAKEIRVGKDVSFGSNMTNFANDPPISIPNAVPTSKL